MQELENLLQEVFDYENYKMCLGSKLAKTYKENLQYRLKQKLNEISAHGLATSFRKVFKKNVKDTPDATLDKIKGVLQATLNTKYEKRNNKIIPNGRTHLELNNDSNPEKPKYCNKERFVQEFEEEDFDEFETKKDLGIKSTPETFLNQFLSIFDEDGWLILEDNYEDTKDVEIPNLET